VTIPQTPILLSLPHPPNTSLSVPGSKSDTNRSLVCAALAAGESRIRNASFSDDSARLAAALRRMGVRVDADEAARTATVAGAGGTPLRANGTFNCGNAGTALRFLVSLAATGLGRAVIDGDARMRQRPIRPLTDALAALGVRARCSPSGCPPVEIEADGLPGGTVRVDASVSSQYLSSLLLAAPAAKGPVTIEVAGEPTSKSYVDMTLAVMRAFGASVQVENGRRFAVDSARRYRAADHTVEPDAAGANYFLAIAAATGGRVKIQGLGAASVQGELKFADCLRRMGCAVTQGPDWTEVDGSAAALNGIDADLNDFPDSAQTLAVLALFADGPTTIRNVPNLRVKETDRIAALEMELTKLGAKVETRADGLTVVPAKTYRPATIDTYDDHRMAMSFAIAALKIPGTSIANPACVAKSFPEFFETLETIGVSVHGGPGTALRA
jgi:3-phosphoshikimate 1-carboxyvinyltransferase